MSALLDASLPLDAAGRQTWLGQLAPHDQDLEPALRKALLTAGGQVPSSEYLDALPDIAPWIGSASACAVKPRDRVGAYRVIRELGSGGMAEVWLAERADDSFSREVALKLPKQIWQRQDLAQRFERERNILAGLEHPHIARLYDAGFTGEGLPYLALEYVPGLPLTDWCNERAMGVRERLQLFLQVLDAVQYAHERQVIHRDLKPSNILVTAAAKVMLLDFGVAKMLTDDKAMRTQITEIHGLAMTPAYASPELLQGGDLTAQTDIYSLGVLLYELLTGNRPYELKAQASIAQLEQAIVTTQITPPSRKVSGDGALARATTPEKLTRRLRGDLDAIVMRALAKTPLERYPSASAFADDIQRHLAGQTIEARPNHFFYRLGKFIRRHRRGTALATAVAVLAFVTTCFVLLQPPSQYPTAVGNNTLAAQTGVSDKSIAVLAFADMSEKHDQEYFSDGLSEELIDHLGRAADLKVIARTSSFQFKGKNEDMRAIAAKLGVAHVLEGSVRKSGQQLRVTAKLIRASDGTHLWSQTYERNMSDIFKVQDEIAGTVAQALKVTLRADGPGAGTNPSNTDAYNLLLQANFFAALTTQDDTKKAIALYKRAIALDPKFALAWARLSLAYLQQSMSGWVPIREGNARAKQAVVQALTHDPNLAYAHYIRGVTYELIDWDWQAAQAEFARAEQLSPGNPIWKTVRTELAAWLTGQFDESIDAHRQRVETNPVDPVGYWALANTLYFAGRLGEAADMWRKVSFLMPDSAGDHAMLAYTLVLAGKFDEALAAAEKEPDEGWRLSATSVVYWALGRKTQSDATLQRLESKFATVLAYEIAVAHAYRGEVDLTIHWLNRAYRLRDAGCLGVKTDPLLANLHSDPRYQAFLRKMNMPE
jgi:serine/threonine protein kinase/TolB-like protein